MKIFKTFQNKFLLATVIFASAFFIGVARAEAGDLTVYKSGTGSGTITSVPAGINCGSTCTATFTNGTYPVLTATPASGSSFMGWEGTSYGGCHGTGQCNSMVMTASGLSLQASFYTNPPSTPKQVYYSVGQNTNDHKTGTPTVTIAAGVATFSVAQTATNMGVGDRVTYNGSTVAYISSKISTTQWRLVTATGGTPANVTGVTVNSIRHEYSSLFNAISYYASPAYPISDANHLNTRNLVTGNYILNIPLYYDSGADVVSGGAANMISLIGYPASEILTTSPANYIKIYTPNNISTEVNQSQRHMGKWDATKYNLRVSPTSSGLAGIQIEIPNIKIDGLQMELNSTFGAIGISQLNHVTPYDGMTEISNNIIKGNSSISTAPLSSGIELYSGLIPSPFVVNKVWNNIIYDIKGTLDPSTSGNITSSAINKTGGGVAYLYSNTLVNNNIAYTQKSAYNSIFKDNLAQSSVYKNYCPMYPTGIACAGHPDSTNNLSDDDYAPLTLASSNPQTMAIVSFVNTAGKDFHLASGDTAATGKGANLSTDSYLSFSVDIDGDTRTSPWSIGADHPAATYSVTVIKAGTGLGTVSSNPAGISNCGTTCWAYFNSGSTVVLTAATSTGSTFTGWAGNCSGATSTCSLTMNAAKTVTATFATTSYALTVTKAGTGSGTVTSNPAGINCGATCTANYNASSTITLTASTTAGSTFNGWSGACSGTGTCIVTMNATKAVTATYTLNSSGPAVPVYYSVGQNTNDHKTGTPTVTIAAGVATFSVAQTATNMGVGDRVTYGGTNIAYIASKISTTRWRLVTATGGTPGNVNGVAVNSIRHEYSSLFNAISYNAVPSYQVSDANHLNTLDLVTGNYILNIPVYYDSGPEIVLGGATTPIKLDRTVKFTTSAANYIRIYTPTSTTTEVNLTQRHAGKWDSTKFTIQYNKNTAGVEGALVIGIPYVKVDGLQFNMIPTLNSSSRTLQVVSTAAGWIELSNNIIKGQLTSLISGSGIGVDSTNGITSVKIWNNLIYDFTGNTGGSWGIIVENDATDNYLYNNTLVNNANGIVAFGGASDLTNVTAKNNLVQDSISQDYIDWKDASSPATKFTASSRNNISNDVISTAPGTSSKQLTTANFVSRVGKDFHLISGDTAALGAGVDLSGDASLAFTTDIDGDTRTSPWSIGADSVTPVSYVLNTAFGTGTGTISATGISCPGDCTETYSSSSWVTLIATPGSGQSFGSWTSGAGTICGGQGSTCTDLMNANKTATANFVPQFNYSLSNSGTSNVTKTSGNAFGSSTITKTLTSGSTQPVTIDSITGLPSGVSYSVSGISCSPTCTSVITFTVVSTTTPGTYPLVVNSSPLAKSTSFDLVVTAAPMTVSCSSSPATAQIGDTVTWTGVVTGGVPPLTYAWSGTNIPAFPAPSTNPYTIKYGTVGVKTAQLTVTGSDSVTATCSQVSTKVNVEPTIREF